MLADHRIGMITPSANTAVEPITTAFVHGLPGVSVHFTRIPVSEVGLGPDSDRQFTIERFEAAARLLLDARVQVVAWNGTSGSWMGIDEEREMADTLGERLGVPFLTSTSAMLDVLRERGVRRYSLAVPYAADLAEAIVESYRRRGLTCARVACRGWQTEQEAAATDEDLFALLEDARHVDAEAIVVVCTNVAAATVVASFEERYGIPVVDSILVTASRSLRRSGFRTSSISGWGTVAAGDLCA